MKTPDKRELIGAARKGLFTAEIGLTLLGHAAQRAAVKVSELAQEVGKDAPKQ